MCFTHQILSPCWVLFISAVRPFSPTALSYSRGSAMHWALWRWMCALLRPTLCGPKIVAHQALLPMEFSRQEYRVGCHFLLQGIFLTQG